MSEIQYANIMVLGYTGAGKSSFINYLVGKEVRSTGIGVPVTQDFDIYEDRDVAGIPLRIFDSKGLEVKDYDKIEKDIFSFVQKRCGSENPSEWIHSIFYCINISSGRFQPKEIEFIKNLSGKTSQTMHVIITHCGTSKEWREKNATMIEHVEAQLKDKKIRVFCVNSVKSETRVGTTPTFGRQEILDSIFETLWSDIANKISKVYAQELHNGLEEIVRQTVFKACDSAINKVSSIGLISDLISDSEDTMNQMEEAFDKCFEEWDRLEEKLEEKCREKLKPFVRFCNEYGNSMGYELDLYDFYDFLPDDFMDFDVDEIMEQSRLGRAYKEIEDIDEAKGVQLFFKAGKAVITLLSMKKLMKECFEDFKYEIRKSIPSCNQLEKSIYDNLMKGFHQ